MKPGLAHASGGFWKTSLDNWQQAMCALRLLAMDASLGGIVVRARSGPVRDRFLADMTRLIGPAHRVHPATSDEALFGGLDVSATLAHGAMVQQNGLLDRGGTLMLTMAERCPAGLAAKLAMALDSGRIARLVILDEGAETDETAPPGLAERIAFFVDLNDVALADIIAPETPVNNTAAKHTTENLHQITDIAQQLGIDSLRAPMFALRAARVHAAMLGRAAVTSDDIEAACLLTLTHKATQFPQETEDAPAQDPSAKETPDQPQDQQMPDLPDDMLLDAVRAMLPDDLLDRIAAQKARRGKGNGSGAIRKGNRRGRPLPARHGRLSDGARIDLMGTLRAAAPWQTIRRNITGQDRLHIRASDIHVKRYAERSDRVLIFAVDASGSAALARLAEAKGAIELLLAQAYARRDHVSLIAFRGTAAELLLPPTRSLVQTKRRLASLPGGGGTPLAAGLQEGLLQAMQAHRKGLTPTVVLLTDGRANIALDGAADRKQAATDASQIATALRTKGIDALVIDTGQRPERSLKALAHSLDAPYLPLPRADAQRLSAAVAGALET